MWLKRGWMAEKNVVEIQMRANWDRICGVFQDGRDGWGKIKDATVAWKELHCVVFVSRCRQPTRSNFDSSAFGRCHLTYTVNHHDRSKKILIWTSIWMFRFFHSFYLENSAKLTSSAQEVYFQPWLTNARPSFQHAYPCCFYSSSRPHSTKPYRAVKSRIIVCSWILAACRGKGGGWDQGSMCFW